VVRQLETVAELDRDRLYVWPPITHNGHLMERHKITAAAAFDLLVHTSQHRNIKLHQVCRHLADTGELPLQR